MNENFKVIKTIIPEFIAQYSSFDIQLLVPTTAYEPNDAFTMTFTRPDNFKTTELSGQGATPQTIDSVEYLTFVFKITPFHTNVITGSNPTASAKFSFRGTRTAIVNGTPETIATFSSGVTSITIHRSAEPILEVFGSSELSNLQGRVQALELTPPADFITTDTETDGNGLLFGDGSNISFITLDEELEINNGILELANPFDPEGDYTQLRARATTKEDVGLGNVTNEAQIPLSQKGQVNGVATLDPNGKIPLIELPDLAKTTTTVLLSTDVRPCCPEPGDKLYETDTGDSFI